MNTPLLQTKLYIPTPRPELIVRSRLIEQLNEGLHRKLTLVSAPAGFGKTTLISNWLNTLGQTKDTPLVNRQSKIVNQAAWFSLDDADNEPARFLDYFLAALGQVSPDVDQAIRAIRETNQPMTLDTILPTLINTLTASPHTIILVLDDYHLIQTQAIHDALSFLLDHLPSPLHLVLTSRADPPFALARYRVRGQITEIRADDLRFSTEEATQFLQEAMGIDVSLEDVTILDQRTEGWISGLQMAALSLQKQADISAFIKAFTGSHRYVMDYLTEEVLHQRPQGTQTFLLKTSILDRISAPLADFMTEDSNGQTVLEQLEAANFFLIPLDDERRWYRYHHLFADLLRQQLHREMPEMEIVLHQRASHWFEATGFINEAIEHALAATDFERAAGLMKTVALDMAGRVEVVTLGRWFDALPKETILSHPQLIQPFVMILSMTSQFEEMKTWLQAAEEIAAANPKDRAAQEILGEVAGLTCVTTFLFGDYPNVIPLSQRTQKILVELNQSLQRWSLISVEAYTNLVWWSKVSDVRKNLTNAAGLAEAEGGGLGGMLTHAFLNNYHVLRGRLRVAQTSAQRSLDMSTRSDGSYLPSGAYPQSLLGRLYYERNELDVAQNYLVSAVSPLATITGFCTDPVDTIWPFICLKWCQGDVEGADQFFDEAEAHFLKLPISPAFRVRLGAVGARLKLMRDDLDEAGYWADSIIVPTPETTLRPLTTFTYLTWARIRLAQGKFDFLEPALNLLNDWAESIQLNGLLIEITMLQSLLWQQLGDVETACDFLRQALTLAEPEGYVRLFVDEGEPMQYLLQEFTRKQENVAYAYSLLSVFEGTDRLPQKQIAPTPHQQDLIEPLTSRELELLALLAEGLTNQEIATQLVIAVSTVKRHTINIYGKLGVRNRTEAVAKARVLSLL